MEVPIVSFLENYTLDELFKVFSKYGVCSDFVVEGNKNTTNKNRIFVGSITAVYRPKINSMKKSRIVYALNAVNLVTKNHENETPVRIVLLGNIVRKLLETKVKKGDVIAILNPKLFFVNYLDSELATVVAGPLNVILWLCRDLKVSDSKVNSSPKKITSEDKGGSAVSCQGISLSADNVPGPNGSSIPTKQAIVKNSPKKVRNNHFTESAPCHDNTVLDGNGPSPNCPSTSAEQAILKTPPKKVRNKHDLESVSCQDNTVLDDKEPSPDCPSTSVGQGHNTRGKPPAKIINQRVSNSAVSSLQISSDNADDDPDYSPSVSSGSGYNTRRKSPAKNIKRVSTRGQQIVSDVNPDPDYPSSISSTLGHNTRVKKPSKDGKSGSEHIPQTDSDGSDADSDCGPSVSIAQGYNTRGKTPAKIINQRVSNSAVSSLQISTDNADADPDYCPSVSSRPGYNTRGKTPAKIINQRISNSAVSSLQIDSDNTDADPDYRPSVSSALAYNTRRKTSAKNISQRANSSTYAIEICSDDTDADPNYCPSYSSVSEAVEESINEESDSNEKSRSIDSAISASIKRNNDCYRHAPAIIIDDSSQRSVAPSKSSLIINKKTFTKNIPKPAVNLNNHSLNPFRGCVKASPNKSTTEAMKEVNSSHDKQIKLNENSPNKIANCFEKQNSLPKRSEYFSQEKATQNHSTIRQHCSPSKFSNGCIHNQSRCSPYSCCLHGPFHCRPEPLCCSRIPCNHFQQHSHCNQCICNLHNRCDCLQDKCFQRNCEPLHCSVRPTNCNNSESRINLANDNPSNKCGRFGFDCPRMNSYADNHCKCCQLKTPCCNFHKSAGLPEISYDDCHKNSRNISCPCDRHIRPARSNEGCDRSHVNAVERTRNWVINCKPPTPPPPPPPPEQDVVSLSGCDSSVISFNIQKKVIPRCLGEVTSRNVLNTFMQGKSVPVHKKKRKLFNHAESPCISVRNFAENSNSCTEDPTPGNVDARSNLLLGKICNEENDLGHSKSPNKIVNAVKLSTDQLANQKPSEEKSNECTYSNPGPSGDQDVCCNNDVLQESVSHPVSENIPRTEEACINNDDHCYSATYPISSQLEDSINGDHNSIANDGPNKLKDDDLQKKRKKDVCSQSSNETSDSESRKKLKMATIEPSPDRESIKSIETVDLQEVISHVEKENDLDQSKSVCSQGPLSPKSLVSSAGTFHDALSTNNSQRSKPSPDDQWLMKPIKEINYYSNITSKFSQLDVISSPNEPLTFKLYSSFRVKGIIINMIPPPDDLGSMIMGLCHARCKRTYEYNQFREMEKMNNFVCTNCKHRFHYACPVCNEAGLLHPLCIHFSFDIHLFVNDCVLRVEVDYQDANTFLDCTPATYIRCQDKLPKKIEKVIIKDVTSKDSIIYLTANIKPKHKRGITVLTLHNTSLAKHLKYKNTQYRYCANK